MTRVLVILAVCLLAAVGRAIGQGAPDPFAPPTSVLTCMLTTGEDKSVHKHLTEGPRAGGARTIVASFDSLGTPMSILVLWKDSNAVGGLRTYSFGANWPWEKGLWASGPGDSLADRTSAMTAAEVTRARRLAAETWAQPCERGYLHLRQPAQGRTQ